MLSLLLEMKGMDLIDKLPKNLRAEFKSGPIMNKTMKSVGLQYLAQQQKNYIAKSEGNSTWNKIGLWARIIRKVGRRAKSVTIKEFLTRTSNIKVLRDTNMLFNSIGARRANENRILKVTPLKVIVGTRDKRADKHQKGLTSKWPSRGELEKALARNFKANIPRLPKESDKAVNKRFDETQAARIENKKKEKQFRDPETGKFVATKGFSKKQTEFLYGAGAKKPIRIHKTKGLRKVEKGIRTIKRILKTGKLRKPKRAGLKTNNPDYIRLLYQAEKKGGKPFQLPPRPIIEHPTKSELKELEHLLQVGVTKVFKKVFELGTRERNIGGGVSISTTQTV